jgi:hypothetical protein
MPLQAWACTTCAPLRLTLPTSRGGWQNVPSIFGVVPVVLVLSLSDTIVVAAALPDEADLRDEPEWALVDLVCQSVANVMRVAAQGKPPVTFSSWDRPSTSFHNAMKLQTEPSSG